jgi:hypothetical protein
MERVMKGLIASLRKPPASEDNSLSFDEVFPKEVEVVRTARIKRQLPEGALPNDLVGLAFSGGGIRSATFNLGVIQALAGRHLLRFMDYLSTVSGGGYIGSWLSSWAYYSSQMNPQNQNHIALVEDQLNRTPQSIGDVAEPSQVHFLRKYSNYLTPRLGTLSGDTLAFTGTYIRNLVLNQIILISAVLALLTVPRTLGLVLLHFSGPTSIWVSAVLTVVLLALLCWGIARNTGPGKGDDSRKVFAFIVVPQLFYCAAAAYLLWQLVRQPGPGRQFLLSHRWTGQLRVVILVAFVYAFLWFLAALLPNSSPHRGHGPTDSTLRWLPPLWALPAGCVAGAFVLLGSFVFSQWPANDFRSIEYLLTFGVPLGILLVLLVGIVHLGLIGRSYQDGIREWWARMGGAVLALLIYWFALCVVTLFVPVWLGQLWRWLWSADHQGLTQVSKTLSSLGITAAVVSWAGVSLRGLFVAKSAKTGGPGQSSGNAFDDLVVRIAPTVFALGLMVALSLVLYCIVPLIAKDYGSEQEQYWLRPLLFSAALCAVSYFIGTRVDVHEFSLHNAYRNRIVRCYLGATNPNRRPQPFTGFDENDNIFIHWLLPLGAPFHIVNATLNVVKGKELALQARKARSFTFTPLYSGFDYTEERSVGAMPDALKSGADVQTTSDPEVTKPGAYRLSQHCNWKSWQYRGGRLGTAMAISGAAVSPNMGCYTTGAMSFLLTIFCVRLGWWLGNPRRKDSWESGWPRSSWRALMNELTGSTNDEAAEIYLSDGGHFDNLGVYELVRRRCRLIIACDASADPACACDDLASVVEKCRVDFHTEIDINPKEIFPNAPLFPGASENRASAQPYTIGTIRYPGDHRGVLIYIKPSLHASLPQDVLAYARLNPTFPHQSTVDQFFDECQFESYRQLGFDCASATLDRITQEITEG